jgi:hypothetical protein
MRAPEGTSVLLDVDPLPKKEGGPVAAADTTLGGAAGGRASGDRRGTP